MMCSKGLIMAFGMVAAMRYVAAAYETRPIATNDYNGVSVEVNYDESRVAPYTLEDPLTFADGRKVKSAADWESRRKEILGIFAREMFGVEPPPPDCLVTEMVAEKVTCAGYALRRLYRMYFKKDRSGPCVNWVVWAPRWAKKPVPVVVFLNYHGNHELANDPDIPVTEAWLRNDSWTENHHALARMRGIQRNENEDSVFLVETILARGYAVMSACYGEVSPDPDWDEKPPHDPGTFAYTGVFDLWGRRDPERTDNITAIGAWAWALSRGLDLAERIPEIDARRSVVTGYSRLGKAALLAAARDTRFAVCVPNQCGGGGVCLAKRNFGENVKTEILEFPHWYCKAYNRHAENPAKTLTFDQHLLLASIAPRAVLVQGFDASPWMDCKGEFLACVAAAPVWTFLGAGTMPSVPYPDNYETSAIGLSLGYVRRSEDHGISAYDWKWMLDFADRVPAMRDPHCVRLSVGAGLPAFHAAIDRVKRTGGGTIELEKGTYLLDSAEAAQYSFFISNHHHSPVHDVILPMVGLTNVTLRGNGASLVVRGESIGLLVMDSDNVRIENLSLDWERSAMTEAIIDGFDETYGETYLAIDRKRYPYEVSNGRIVMLDGKKKRDVGRIQIFDGVTREFKALTDDLYHDGAGRELPDGRFAVFGDLSREGPTVRVGDIAVLRPKLRNCPATVVYRSKDTAYTDVAIHDALGMGVICQMSENFTWRGSKCAEAAGSGVFVKPGSGRFATTHADASHFSNVKGRVVVENCLFESMMDDAINVHSTCMAIKERTGTNRIRCRYMHNEALGFGLFHPGERLRFIHARTLENDYANECTVTDVVEHGEREMTLVLDRPPPPGINIGDAVENADYQCSVVFRGNIVRFNRARGSLFTTPHPVLIESNVFDRISGSAILFAGDASGWYESGACRDVVVRGNVFRDCCTCRPRAGFSKGILCFFPMVDDLDAQQTRYHENVLVEANLFDTFNVPLLFGRSVANLVWRRNRVIRNKDYPAWGGDDFILRHARNVVVDGRPMPDDHGREK